LSPADKRPDIVWPAGNHPWYCGGFQRAVQCPIQISFTTAKRTLIESSPPQGKMNDDHLLKIIGIDREANAYGINVQLIQAY
ncbi:MAG: hypothetical protein M0Z50_08860, partial [Planctomycetia bacterium]|nr:hypothetical protein [Planctomycetia bacterium]